ncbi:hypothetical protein BD311DRAFT_761502 [Dichomitus squalens]|uniref:Uncharacterized protein n=1 Tax=Dichomitus squalens TaxID=114155 RepID=A0A4Q9MHN6_9APHY|nr:hypothetical protein BD311DRAFT_761502 [Dichomitus squalens]
MRNGYEIDPQAPRGDFTGHMRTDRPHHWADQVVPVEFARDELGVDTFEHCVARDIREEIENARTESFLRISATMGPLETSRDEEMRQE